MRRVLVLCATVAMAACGADVDGEHGTPTGVDGEQGTPTDVTIGGALPGHVDTAMAAWGAAYCLFPRASLRANVLGIRVSSFAQVCSLAQSGDRKAHETFVDIRLAIWTRGAVRPPITPGTYAVGDTNVPETGDTRSLQASVVWTTEICYPDSSPLLAGTVTITSISDAVVTGTLDLSHSDGDTPVKGTFSAVPCALPAANDCPGLYPPPSLVCRP
jgi:hypothetical protein